MKLVIFCSAAILGLLYLLNHFVSGL